jgi:glutamine synthetase
VLVLDDPPTRLEQELFFIPREAYERRMDLQFAGRTVMGKMPARGQVGTDD